MSQKDRELLEKLRALPEATQQRFIDKLDGAAMVLETTGAKADTGGQKEAHECGAA
jgi:hypothetical protein